MVKILGGLFKFFSADFLIHFSLKFPILRTFLHLFAKGAEKLDGKTTELTVIIYLVTLTLEKLGKLPTGASQPMESFAVGAGGVAVMKRVQKYLPYIESFAKEVIEEEKKIEETKNSDEKKSNAK